MKFFLLKIMILVFLALNTKANILWVGGEDIDFPNPPAAQFNFWTATNMHRADYSRYGIEPLYDGMVYSNAFTGGPVTSFWLSFTMRHWGAGKNIGLVKTGTSNALFMCTSGNNVGLCKFNGTTWTQLAMTTSNVLTSGPVRRIDIQVSNQDVSTD